MNVLRSIVSSTFGMLNRMLLLCCPWLFLFFYFFLFCGTFRPEMFKGDLLFLLSGRCFMGHDFCRCEYASSLLSPFCIAYYMVASVLHCNCFKFYESS